MTPEEYLKTRVDDQISWYDGKSQFNQHAHKRLRATEIVLAASIPFLVSYASDLPYMKVLTGVAGVVIAVIAGVVALYRFRENWITYRATGDTLKREKVLYLTGAPPATASTPFRSSLPGGDGDREPRLENAVQCEPAGSSACTAGSWRAGRASGVNWREIARCDSQSRVLGHKDDCSRGTASEQCGTTPSGGA